MRIDWPALGGVGSLLGILGSLLVLNFRALFRRDSQVWDLIADYKAQISDRDDQIEAQAREIKELQQRYYDLLTAQARNSFSRRAKPSTGEHGEHG